MKDEILNLLDSTDPRDRKRAIAWMVNNPDEQSLRYLSVLYKSDPDPEIRELAVKAGRRIKRDQESGKWAGHEESKEKPKTSGRTVSAMDRDRSIALAEQAMDESVKEEHAKALTLIRKAFQINPDLANDGYYVSMAAEITNLPPDAAVDELLYGVDGRGEKRKNDEKGEITWGAAMTELAIYGIVMSGIAAVSLLLQNRFGQEWITTLRDFMSSSQGIDTTQLAEFDTIMLAFAQPDLATLIFGSITSGFFQVLGLMFMYLFVHLAAKIVGGTGSYRGLIYHATGLFTIFTAASTVILGVWAYSLINQFVNNLMMVTNEEELSVITANGFNSLTTMGVFSIVVSLIFTFIFASRIGRNYDFGMMRGCVAIFLSYVFMFAIFFACALAFGALIGQLLQGIVDANTGAFIYENF